jgi:hypothetical protein
VRRVLDWFPRRLVRWLRRHRYATVAGRIRALEIELGMAEPTIADRGLKALANASAYGGVGAYWIDEADVQQHATGHGRNYFANGNMVIGGTLPDLPPVPKLPPFAPDPRLTTRTSE